MSANIDWSKASEEEIATQVQEIAKKNLSKPIDHSTDFATAGFDSLEIAEFSMALEEVFKINFDEKDMAKLTNFDSTVKHIMSKLQEDSKSAAAA